MSKKVLDAIKKNKNIKEAIAQDLSVKMTNKLEQKKMAASKNLVSEAEVDVDTSTADLPTGKEKDAEKAVAPKATGPVRITRMQIKPGYYRFLFPFNNKIMIVDFEPTDENHTKFAASVHAKGQEKSDKPLVRLGVSNLNLVPSLFTNVLRAIEQFLIVKRPASIRFVAGKDVEFPPVFHQYIYQALKDFSSSPVIKKGYTVIRGDSTKDGSAFALRRGAAQSNLKSKSWRPTRAAAKNEQIANVTGPAVATDRPTKSGMGFPGLAKETEKEKKKLYTAIERRKKNY